MKNNFELKQENLGQLAGRLSVPAYERKHLQPGIVHIGVGGFHRAHLALYLHRLLAEGWADGWSISGVGLREGDRKMQEVLGKQDGLYTLIVRHPDGNVEAEVVGSIVEYILGVDDPDAVIDRMANPATKIVSLTITEGGYNFDPSTEAFDFDNPDVRHDLKHPDRPVSVFGFLTAALRKRRAAGLPAFTVLSCDNVQENGDVARAVLLAFAGRQDPDLAVWIRENVRFPNSMVDRITPVTTPGEMAYLEEEYGLKDAWPVTCEPFLQWVIEDDFSNGRPSFEKVGVQFVADVKPYEKMKLRLLNAGHSFLGIFGALQGYPTIDACMKDPLFASSLRTFMDKEVTPTLDALDGIDLDRYKDSLAERFANPNIKDSVGRICSESSAKLPKFLLPTLRENLESGGEIHFATLVIAAWCYYSDKGMDREGNPLTVIDAQSEALQQAARNTVNDPLAFLRQPSVFGNLADNERFTTLYAELITGIYKDGSISNHLT